VGNRIVVVGSLNMDLVGCAERIPVVGETIVGHTYFTEPGGKGANQAYAAARLGGQVSMLGRVGDDDFGREMRANLEQVGCDTSGLATTPNCRSGIALIFVADTGQNSIVIVTGANDLFSAADVQGAENKIRGAAAVLLQLENPVPTVLEAARIGHKLGAKVILDPAPARQIPDELLQLADVVTPNETEAAILAGLPPGRLEPDRASEIARKLRSRGANIVIVKLGDQGCLLVGDGAPRLFPAPRVDAVDSTAAGDVFNGAFAVGVSEGLDFPSACTFSNRAAALSVTRRGAQASVPSREELQQFAAPVGS
jgi:ribokinase